MNTMVQIITSWVNVNGNVNDTKSLLSWIDHLNKTVQIAIKKIPLTDSDFWFWDSKNGDLRNKNNSFFKIKGIIFKENGEKITEQPIIIQDEIGYLGIICKEIDGMLNFLMQAKIEPGNINKIQISPTIQATKSNFTQKHQGNKPPYLDFFLNAEKHEIIVDQIQSEQSSRFCKKRNRNIIIKIKEEVEVLPNFKWMTLGQIKTLMKIDNLVNMDTRTVLSCIPFAVEKLDDQELKKIETMFLDKALFHSIFIGDIYNSLPLIYSKINNYKMFSERSTDFVALDELENWKMENNEFICNKPYPFKLIFCHIDIEGREVKTWTQPLFEAIGMATFGLFVSVINGMWKFLVRITPEIGCFDLVELGPSVQLKAGESFDHDVVSLLFKEKWNKKERLLHNVILSEEGGRFYHEKNYNLVIKIDENEIPELPEEYIWVDFYTLNHLVQVNNCLNIQLRNLLSLLEVSYGKN